MKKITKISLLAAIMVAFLSLTGCVKTVKLVGYTPEGVKFDKLVVGKTRKAVVKRELGSPSATSSYGGDTWYYISMEQERIAFLKPKIISQKVVAIKFNDDDTIQSVQKFDENDIKKIKFSSDITKTEGHDTGILGQLLGNVGRFNTDKRDATKPR